MTSNFLLEGTETINLEMRMLVLKEASVALWYSVQTIPFINLPHWTRVYVYHLYSIFLMLGSWITKNWSQVFLAEGVSFKNVLTWEGDWHIQREQRLPVWLKQRE